MTDFTNFLSYVVISMDLGLIKGTFSIQALDNRPFVKFDVIVYNIEGSEDSRACSEALNTKSL